MNSANAFSYAISGSFTDDQMQRYGNFINQSAAALQGLGGWLSDTANKSLEKFDSFLNSRAWEMSKRLLGASDGDFVPRYQIGYLGSLSAQQGAEGLMVDYIMANPLIMQMYIDGQIEGYGGEFSPWNFGVGEENLFYRKAMSGVLNLETIEGVNKLRHTHFQDSVGGKVDFREKVNVHKTWTASNHHIATTQFDVTSKEGKRRKEFEDED